MQNSCQRLVPAVQVDGFTMVRCSHAGQELMAGMQVLILSNQRRSIKKETEEVVAEGASDRWGLLNYAMVRFFQRLCQL
jgi:hypothetical protein